MAVNSARFGKVCKKKLSDYFVRDHKISKDDRQYANLVKPRGIGVGSVSSNYSTSRQKYIGYYRSFVQFLVLNVSSSEYVPAETSHTLEIKKNTTV